MISFFIVCTITSIFLEISMKLPMHYVLLSINLAAVSVEQQKYAKIGHFCAIIGSFCSI